MVSKIFTKELEDLLMTLFGYKYPDIFSVDCIYRNPLISQDRHVDIDEFANLLYVLVITLDIDDVVGTMYYKGSHVEPSNLSRPERLNFRAAMFDGRGSHHGVQGPKTLRLFISFLPRNLYNYVRDTYRWYDMDTKPFSSEQVFKKYAKK
jgi:hypothetical protein